MKFVRQKQYSYTKKELEERSLLMEERHPGYCSRIQFLTFLANALIVYRIIFVAYSYLFVVSASSPVDLLLPVVEIVVAWGWLKLILYSEWRGFAVIMLVSQAASFVKSISFMSSLMFYHLFFTIYVVMYTILCLSVVVYLLVIVSRRRVRETISDHAYVLRGGGVMLQGTMEKINQELEYLRLQDEVQECEAEEYESEGSERKECEADVSEGEGREGEDHQGEGREAGEADRQTGHENPYT